VEALPIRRIKMSNAFMRKDKKNRMKTDTMVKVGLMIALSVVLKLVLEVYVPLAGLPALRINFTSVPIILSGIICGPLAGLLTGALSDLICFVVKPGGVYFPGFTLTSALVGFIPGLIYKYMKKDINYNILNTAFIVLIAMGFAGVFITRGVVTFVEGAILYNGQQISWIFPVLFVILTAAFIYIPIKTSVKVEGIRMDKILFTVSITQLITSIILNTYFLSILFGKGVLVFLPGRIFTNYILIPLFSMFTAILLKSVESYNKTKVEVRNVIQE
jgi:ECF transporter S component (folate family)